MRKTVQRVLFVSAMVLFVMTCVSCTYFRHGEKKQKHEAVVPQVMEAAPAQPTVADREADLRQIVCGQIQAATQTPDAEKSRVIRSKPYFYKRWDVYPEGSDPLKIEIQEKESRSIPYVADVTVPKQQFATRLHRERAEAEKDTNFLRDTGTEMVTFEFRNGRWVRTGSLFIADKSEENVNGEWIQIDETVKRTVAAEEDRSEGWLSRTWSMISGRPSHKTKPDKEKEPTTSKSESRGFQFGGQPRNR